MGPQLLEGIIKQAARTKYTENIKPDFHSIYIATTIL